MGIRDNLFGPKRPHHVVTIDGFQYRLQHATSACLDCARRSSTLPGKAGTTAAEFNAAKYAAWLLVYMLVDEGGNLVLTPADVEAIIDSELGSVTARLAAEASSLVNEDQKAGNASTLTTAAT